MKEAEGLSDWTFEIREVSAGVYNVHAVHSSGASIGFTDGCNEELLLKRAKEEAVSMQKTLNELIAAKRS